MRPELYETISSVRRGERSFSQSFRKDEGRYQTGSSRWLNDDRAECDAQTYG